MDNSVISISLKARNIIANNLKESFEFKDGHSRLALPDKYKSLLDNLNGFIVLCNYTTGLYEYVSESIRSCLGYDVTKFTNLELTHFLHSIMEERQLNFMVNSLVPVVFKHLTENATVADGTDYRYSVCVKMRDVYNNYRWYLLDTVVAETNPKGFPTTTVIICTNIHQFKRDELVYYNIMKKNNDGVYEVMLEGTEDNKENEYKLTPREIEIVNLIGQGFTNKEIAGKLFISLHTVQTHRKSVLRKTKCSGTAELTNFAFSRGLL